MARFLLGVSGGVAAFKALQLTPAGVQTGHGRRGIPAPPRQRVVGPGPLAGHPRPPGPVERFHARPLAGAACPVVVAPAMTDRMYGHPATRETLGRLRDRGVTVIPPAEGELASRGEHGVGRLAEPAELLGACEALLAAASDAERSGPWTGL